MESNSQNIRDELLSQLPRPENLAEYRNEVAALLEKNRKGLRREKWGTAAIWVFVVGLTVLLTSAGMKMGTSNAAYLGTFASLFLIWGAAEVLKHFINRSRVELLTEIKQVQLQVLELHETLHKPAP